MKPEIEPLLECLKETFGEELERDVAYQIHLKHMFGRYSVKRGSVLFFARDEFVNNFISYALKKKFDCKEDVEALEVGEGIVIGHQVNTPNFPASYKFLF